MTYPRRMSVSLESTPYYHMVSRCVRRAWLWGVDKYTGKDYSHRKAWVLDRLSQLCAVFAVDCLVYAVMSNHYHLGLRVDVERTRGWSDAEVVERWTRLFRKPILIERWLNGSGGEAERAAALEIIKEWRSRLQDPSWFMKNMNEHLARLANAEDGCTGRFWQGRFKSQALLDEVGLLSAMVYVDLNPIRARIAATPEEPEFTSIQARILELKEAGEWPAAVAEIVEDSEVTDPAEEAEAVQVPLLKFRDEVPELQPAIPFGLVEYVELVDWSAQVIRGDKRGAMEDWLPPLLRRLNIDREAWRKLLRPGGNVFIRAIGKLDHLLLYAKAMGKHYLKGQQQAQFLYGI